MYAVLAFVGAFLLFFLQPLVGKSILPMYGGGAQVWVTCMLFFQIMLLAAYAYAHCLLSAIKGRQRQAWVHGTLLALGAFQLLLNGYERGSPFGFPAVEGDLGSLSVLYHLFKITGFPLLALGATAPLLQKWFSDEVPQHSAYRLYAASNLGSLMGLLVFPFGTERWFPASTQAFGLLFGFMLFGSVLVWKISAGRDVKLPSPLQPEPSPAPNPGSHALWIFTSAVGVMLLMSTTSFLTQEIAPIPLLWVAPLVAYLLTFILIFESRLGNRWGLDLGWSTLLGVVLIGLISLKSLSSGYMAMVAGGLVGLFLVCLGVHGFLFSLRPAPIHLTRYYLLISLGGVLGGAYTALLAPSIFERGYELGQAYAFAGFVALFWISRTHPVKPWKLIMPLAAMAAGGGLLFVQARKTGIFYRDLYGTLSVRREGRYLSLWHGQTMHGMVDSQESSRPLAYYAPTSGAGRALLLQRARKGNLHVGVLGLGLGSMAAYGRKGDSFTFFEICPMIARLAGPEDPLVFTLLKSSPAKHTLIMGDGRSSLERERTRGRHLGFDFLMVDAFNGDAIPWHLLTMEALQLYVDHLAPDGILALHLSNNLPIYKVAVANVRAMGLNGLLVVDPPSFPTFKSTYLLVSRDPSVLRSSAFDRGDTKPSLVPAEPPTPAQIKATTASRPWRDDWCAVSDLLFE